MPDYAEKLLFGKCAPVATTDIEEVLFRLMDDLSEQNAIAGKTFNSLYAEVMRCKDAKGKVNYHFTQRTLREED